jgi:very-short-patch-repair endonuclease
MTHRDIPVWLLVLPALAALAMAVLAKPKRRTATGDLSAKTPLTDREQSMYFRLLQALPEQVILAQVALSALLDTKDRPTRATFDRKVADFVICSKAFRVIAVVELDDASHRGRQANDASRDQMLTKAGIKTLRFKNIPDADDLRRALQTGPMGFSADR